MACHPTYHVNIILYGQAGYPTHLPAQGPVYMKGGGGEPKVGEVTRLSM